MFYTMSLSKVIHIYIHKLGSSQQAMRPTKFDEINAKWHCML